MLFYQDFNEQFEGYTQQEPVTRSADEVVLSGFQWTILLQKYRKNRKYANLHEIILIFMTSSLHLSTHLYLRGHRSWSEPQKLDTKLSVAYGAFIKRKIKSH